MSKEIEKTTEQVEDWQLYLNGINYNQELYGADKGYYETIDVNYAFVSGDQWRGVESNELPKPQVNIIKRVLTFLIASLTSNKVSISLESMQYRPQQDDIQEPNSINEIDLANKEMNNILEKCKIDFRLREGLFDAGVTGDMAMHFYFDMAKKPFRGVKGLEDIKGECCLELIDGQNVMFGNPNIKEVEKQPYILLIGRDTVKNLQKEYEQNRKKDKDNTDTKVNSDLEYQFQAGDNAKVEIKADNNTKGKALYIIKYFKDENGHIKASKFTQNTYIYENKDTALEKYPLAWFNWSKVKGSYHGRGEVTGLIPNQIAINKMFAMVIYHLMHTSFPKLVYNGDKVQYWSNQIGTAIKLHNLSPGESVRNVADYLNPGSMSEQIIKAIDMIIQYTKEMMGVSDASLGNINPQNTSAIIAIQKSTAVPLELIRANLFEFVEDCGQIILDIIANKYGERPVVYQNGNIKQAEMFDFARLKGMWLNLTANVGDSTYWSEISSLTTLDNLLNAGRIEFLDYLERVPDGMIPNKEELIQALEERQITDIALQNIMLQYMQSLQMSDPNLYMQLMQIKDPEQQKIAILQSMGALQQEQQGQEQQPTGMTEINQQQQPQVSPEVIGAVSDRSMQYLENRENEVGDM